MRRRAVSSGGDTSTQTSTKPTYIVETTPTGQQFWINPDDPSFGYLSDPSKDADAMAYPIEYINWLLRPSSPSAGEVNASATGASAKTISGVALNGNIPLLYGQRWIGSSIFFGPRKWGADKIVMGYGLSHGPCDSLVDVKFKTGTAVATLIAAGVWSHTFYPGLLSPPAADPSFAAAAVEATTNFERYPGLCYVSGVATWADGQFWTNLGQAFPQPQFLLKGRKVRNYATGLDTWTDNPAYCLADYITSTQYGRGARVNTQSVIDVAGECDALVVNPATGLSVKKHTLNIFLLRSANHKSHIDAMRAHFRCNVIERGGEFVLIYDKDRTSVMSFDPTSAVPVNIERVGTSGAPNQVAVTFQNSAADDEPTPTYARTSGVEAGTDVIRPADYTLEGCTDQFHAASEAFYLLNSRLNNLRAVLRTPDPKAMKLEPFDVIQYTTGVFGMSSFALRVLRVTRSADGTSHTIETVGHDPAIYAFQSRAVETYPLPNPPSDAPQNYTSRFLTTPSVAVPSEPDGTLPVLTAANGRAIVMLGTADVSASATFGPVVATNCTGTVNTAINVPVGGQPKGYYQVTAMSADAATLDIPVTYGGTTISLRFTLTKARAGTGYTLIPRRTGVVLSHTSLGDTSVGAWDGDVRSAESYTNGVYASCQPGHVVVAAFLGLNSDPLTVTDWTRLDYAWHMSSDGTLYTSESGVLVHIGGTYTVNTKLLITYDGNYVRWYVDGLLMRSTPRPVGLPLFLDCVSATGPSWPTLTNLSFGPFGETGSTLFTMIPRNNGKVISQTSIGTIAATGVWDGNVYSAESYTRGASITFNGAQFPAWAFVGLNTDPTSVTTDYTRLDYAWHLDADGHMYAYMGGEAFTALGTYTSATKFALTYDGNYVRWWADGVLIRSVARPIGQPLFLDCCLTGDPTQPNIVNLNFGPMGSSSDDTSYTPVLSGNIVQTDNPNSFRKSSGADAWDSGVSSAEVYDRGAYVSFRSANVPAPNVYMFAGLDTATVLDPNLGDYVWHLTSATDLTFTAASSQAIDAGAGATLKTNGDFTASSWIRPTSIGAAQGICGNEITNTSGFSLRLNAAGNLVLRVHGSGVLQDLNSSPVAVAAGVWTYVAVTVSGTTVTFYINGAVVATGTISITRVLATANYQLARMSATTGNFFGGELSDERFYNAALSASDILKLYNGINPPTTNLKGWWPLTDGAGTSIADLSGNANTGTLVGTPTWLLGSTAYIIENGTQQFSTTYTVGTAFAITYDSFNVRYYKDGSLVRTVTRPVGAGLKLVSGSLRASPSTAIGNLSFGPMGTQGSPATAALAEKNALAGLGGNMLITASTRLMADASAGAASIIVKDNVLATGDVIVMRKVVAGAAQTEYMSVTSGPTGLGPYTYGVTRNLSGAGAGTWTTDDPVSDLGQAGSFFIDGYSIAGMKSSSEVGPTIVGNLRNSTTYNDWTPRWAIGNLNGLYGYATNIFGVAFGVPTGAWVKIDPTNGVRIGFNATTKVQIDASGNATFSGDITAAGGSIGAWTINSVGLVGNSGAVIRAGQTTYDSGTGFFLGNVSGTPKFSIGNSSGARLTWDGTTFVIGNPSTGNGGVTITGSTMTVNGYLTLGSNGYLKIGIQSAANLGTLAGTHIVNVGGSPLCLAVYNYTGAAPF